VVERFQTFQWRGGGIPPMETTDSALCFLNVSSFLGGNIDLRARAFHDGRSEGDSDGDGMRY
jgi:hypothetical protein